MQPLARASDAARSVLRTASQRLMMADPTRDTTVNSALDQSLGWQLGGGARLPQASDSFAPSFSETDKRSLAFQVRPMGPGLNATDQREITNGTTRRLIHENFGVSPLQFFDRRTEGMRQGYGAEMSLGARYALGLDSNGLREVQATYEWGPQVLELLPVQVMSLARTVLEYLPNLKPFATAIRTSRMSGGQQVSFTIPQETSLESFSPLMEALGMGHRHGGLVTLLAFVLGARFSLPADVATLTVLNSSQGPEMRLDVNIDALPDVPEQLLPLLRLPMTERPGSLSALDQWLTAMTPDGYYGPGSVTVLSVRVRPQMPARLALYLRPIALEGANQNDQQPIQQPGAQSTPPGQVPLPVNTGNGSANAQPILQ